MNYLKQIRAFDSWEELNPLPDKSYRLWYKLMAIANNAHWPDELSVPVLKLQSELHTTSKQTVINARNALVQAGRIQVTKGKHGKAALYRIIPFPEDNVGLPNGRDSGKESGRGNGLPNGRDSGTYIKQNKTKQNKSNTSDKSPATRHATRPKFADDSVEMQLAMYLFDKIKQNNPEHKELTDSQKQKWADNIRLMIQRDKRTSQQIRNMIEWCQADNFWRNNILSTAKLRKQYDTMAPKAREQWQQRQPVKRIYN